MAKKEDGIYFDKNDELIYTKGKDNICVTLDTEKNLEVAFLIEEKDFGNKKKYWEMALKAIKNKYENTNSTTN